MEYSTASAQVAAEASVEPQKSKKARSTDNNQLAQLALRRCRICREPGHNARICKIDIEGSSDSEMSTRYIGSLFDSSEIEDS